MTELIDPQLPEEHPRSMYHRNLLVGDSVTWYSTDPTPHRIVSYVLGLLRLRYEALRHSDAKFARHDAPSVLFAALTGPKGSALTVFPLDDGAETVSAAIQREWDLMLEQMGKGQFVGFPAEHAVISRGQLDPDTGRPDVFDYINGADVVPVEQ